MFEIMPRIVGSGLFDSRLMFPGKSHTSIRTVTEYELELFFEDGGVSEIGGKSYPIKAGRVLFARPGDIRRSRLHFKCFFAHFECADERLAKMAATLPRVIEVAHPAAYKELFLRLSAAHNGAGEAAALGAVAVLLEILSRLASHHAVTDETALSSTSLVRVAQRYMDRHFAEQLSLADIASFCNLSPIYFHQQYVALAGHTPRDYLADKRIARAKIMLRTEDTSVGAVADACGFSSQSYFCACFKKTVGVTPGQYRKNMRYPNV